MASDHELLQAWGEGDAAAGNTLFDRHFEALYRFFRNKAGDAVDDLVQATFLGCVEARGRFRGDASFRTWMLSIARRKLYDRFRERDRDARRFDPEATSVAALGISPSGAVANKAEHRLLLEALRRLPLISQVALELYYFEGMRGPAIAEVLGIPEPTVRGRLKRGVEQLRREIESGASSPGLAESTLGDLDGWAESIRERLVAQRPGSDDQG